MSHRPPIHHAQKILKLGIVLGITPEAIVGKMFAVCGDEDVGMLQ